MSDMLKQGFPNAADLHEIIDNNYQRLEDDKDLRADLKQMREHNENLVDNIQQMEGQYTKHQHAEQDAVLDANQLQCKVFDLQKKVECQHDQIRAAEKQFYQATIADVADVHDGHFTGLDALWHENDELREALITRTPCKGRSSERSK